MLAVAPFRLAFLSLFVVFSISTPAFSADRTIRIVGGSDVTDFDYPWMTAIYRRGQSVDAFFPICGASLIADRWLLSAAHCFVDSETGQPTDVDDLAFLIDTLDITGDDGIFAAIAQVIIHPAYSVETDSNDIALIQLAAPVNIEPIAIPQVSGLFPQVGETSTVTGWGATSEGGQISPILQEVDLPIVSHGACAPFYENSAVNLQQELAVCAGGFRTGGLDSCQGDSGGPLFVQRGDESVQAGIVSVGLGCARPGVPGVYTRVAAYFDWINSFVSDLRVYTGIAEQDVLAVPEIRTQINANSRTDALVTRGEIDFYAVSGINRISLATLDGDADLFVSDSPVFSDESLVCTSLLAGTSLDECTFENNSEFYIAVSGFVESSYTLTVGDGVQPVVDAGARVLQPNIAATGSLLQAAGDVYIANAGNSAEVTSISGNADLWVFSARPFTLDTLLCRSNETGSAIDSCSFNLPETEAHVVVLGATAADYSLTISTAAVAAPVTATVEEPPTVEPPPVNPQSVGSTADSGGGGLMGPLGLFILLLQGWFGRVGSSAIAFQHLMRVRYSGSRFSK